MVHHDDRRPRRWWFIQAIGGLMALTLIASACGGTKSADATKTTTPGETGSLLDEGQPVTGGKLVFGVTAETNGWNPATAQWADAGNFVGSTFLEPIAVYDSAGKTHPWLAESYSPSADLKSWTITMRQGIKFHDGTEMDAAAVAESLSANLAKGSLTAVALGDKINGVKATGRYTVEVDLAIPWATFDGVIAGPFGYVMAPSMLAKDDGGATSPVGTGAYKFKSWVPDQSVEVTRFDDYWGGPCAIADPSDDIKAFCASAGVPLGQKNGPFLDAMEFRPIPDAQQRANALESGDVNIILTTRAADVAALRSKYTVVTDYNSEQTSVMLNTAVEPFTNIHARKALAYATDRAAIVQQISGGEDIRSDTSPFEESSVWGGLAPDQTGYPLYDPEQARQEVAAYTADTGKALDFQFSGLANVDDITIQQLLQEQWSQVGIKTEVDTLEQSAYIIKAATGDYQAAYFRNYGYPDPDSEYVFWSKSTAKGPGQISINFEEYWSDANEQALETGRTSSDFATRKTAYDSIVKDRNNAVTDIWLFNTPYALVADPSIKGLNWFRVVQFGNFLPKPWIEGLWKT